MSENKLTITAICGSLREGSFNRRVLKAMEELAPKHWEIYHADLSMIPLFNSDIESQGDPQSVAEFKENIRQADGVLIVTPEYNMGIPGVLKNALDWASRPSKSSVLIEKPFAIAGATPGGGGDNSVTSPGEADIASYECLHDAGSEGSHRQRSRQTE
ncbi:hypothetical protein PAECIP111892_05227 [Paenibacillus auburnensis]|uniref:NADPH-dependent FMN reductase-like domain-containing protein n=1 Tax=Paenibacillus auburnensis TaxID=2905649 RepID=A0ABN8H356_9BACL|nr:NADPH-dependent FMN reductase [Paenibacillus auburnensis]CAH1222873.1 hypothetical protein PAECIP111892_05227 [Paenibacillus auburnensis]